MPEELVVPALVMEVVAEVVAGVLPEVLTEGLAVARKVEQSEEPAAAAMAMSVSEQLALRHETTELLVAIAICVFESHWQAWSVREQPAPRMPAPMQETCEAANLLES